MRIESIPNHWKWVTIGDIALTSSGGTPDRHNTNYFNGDIPWVKSGELNYNVINTTEEYITKDALNNSNAKIFPKGSLLIALYGNTVGRMAFLGKEAATNQAVASIFSFLVNSRYLYYYLISSREELLNKREGSAQPNISQKVLTEFPFPLTILEEQDLIVNKIEELFSELDSILKIFNELENKLKAYWFSELNSLLKGTRTNRFELETKNINLDLEEIKKERSAHGLNYKEEDIDIQKEAEKFEIPNSWHILRLSELFVNPVDSISDGPFGSNLKSSDFTDSGFPVLKIQNIDRNRFLNKELSFVSQEKFHELRKCQFESGDVIMTKLGIPLGKACIVPKNIPTGIIVADLIRIKKSDVVSSKFLMYSLNSPYVISQLEKHSKGTTRQRVTMSDVRNLILILPSKEEQQEIVTKIEQCYEEVCNLTDFIKRSILEIGALKQKILKNAFSGNLLYNFFPTGSVEEYLVRIKEEKQRNINLQKEKIRLTPKIKMMKIDLEIETILRNKTEPVTSFSLWQESKYRDNIEEFYRKLKEIDSKIREFKKGHLSYIELIK